MPAQIQLRSFSFKESESPWFDLIPYACRTQICIDCRKDKSDARSKHATGVMQRVQAWLLSTAGKNERNKKNHLVTAPLMDQRQKRRASASRPIPRRHQGDLGCGGVEDLHRDLLHTLLHGASRGKGRSQCGASRTGAADTGSDGCAGTGLGGRALGSPTLWARSGMKAKARAGRV